MSYLIYKYTNKINSLEYVGQTCDSLECRAGTNGHRYKGCPKFYNAILKYKWENFTVQILEETQSKEFADWLEDSYIDLFDTINNGYNLREGGANGRASEETKKKMSKAQIGNKKMLGKNHSAETKVKMRLTRTGRKHTEETKEKLRKPKSQDHKKILSDIKKGQPQHPNSSRLGAHHTEETKSKMRNKIPYNKTSLEKEKQIIDMFKQKTSITDIARETNLNKSTIYKIIKKI